MKKVTIVIPNYNGEKYIDECFSACLLYTSDAADEL